MTEDTSQQASEPTNGSPEAAGSGPTPMASWPTDPRSLGLDPAEIAIHADGDWKPAHQKLLTSLALAYRELVNRTLGTVAKEIGQPLNGWDFKRSKGPRQVTIDAEEELKALKRRRSQHRKGRTELPPASDFDPLSMGIESGTLSGIENGTLWTGPCGGSVATGAGAGPEW